MGNQAQQINYSVPLQGSQQPGFSHIYRNPQVGDKPIPDKPQENILTMKDVHINTYKKNPSRPGLGKILINKKEDDTYQKTISIMTYKEAFQTAQAIGSAILNLGLYSDAQDKTHSNNKIMKFIGIYAKNCQQWGLCDIACATYGITSVPLYDTLGIENLSYCLNHTKMTSCFCSALTATVLLKLKDCGNLQNMILFDLPSEDILHDLKAKFKIIMTFDQLIKKGKENIIDYNKIQIEPNDCFTFSYTSGTTGPPKGAMLSHRNFTALINSVKMVKQIGLNENDRYLSFLPLPHVMQRAITQAYYYAASFVCFYSGDNLKLKEDAQLVQPTVFIAVPKIYSRIQEGVKAKVDEAGGIKKCLFERGCYIKENKMHQTGQCTDWLYDKLVFKNTKQGFGGRVRVMLCGSAPLKTQTHQFMKTILAAPLLQGYGQTEHVAGGLIQKPYDPNLGHVGGLIAGLEMKLADIPEMNYFSTDVDQNNQSTPRGQIWFRGPQVFLGYYKDQKKTKQAVNQQGWLKTGDVGMMMANTRAVKIIDRKKNIFKLQQGEYIAPQKIQSIYSDCPLVSEIVVHGESTHSFAVAILSPHKQHLFKFAEGHGLKNPNYQQMINNKSLRQLVVKELNNYGKKAGLYGFEQAKNIWIVPKTFMDYDLFTNTMKLQRFKVKSVFAKQIEQMYSEGEAKLK